MSAINKIRIGEETHDIVPQIGIGLQFGTGLTNANTIYVNIGEAKCSRTDIPATGMSITPIGFVIDGDKFTNFLKSLGFKTE